MTGIIAGAKVYEWFLADYTGYLGVGAELTNWSEKVSEVWTGTESFRKHYCESFFSFKAVVFGDYSKIQKPER